MKKNVAGQAIGAQMITIADGSNFTGTVTVYITGDNGTQTIGSVGSGICTHKGNGYHSYTPSQAETNYDHIAWTFVGTGAITASPQNYTTFPQTGDSFSRIGVNGAGLTNINLPDQTMDITGSVSGSVGSVTAAVTLPTIPANWITAAGIAASALDGKGNWNVGKTGYDLNADQSAVTIGVCAVNSDMRGTDGAPSVSDILTTAMTEAYAANGVVPSLAELLFEVRSLLATMHRSGINVTIYKIDGTTTAETFVFDDAGNPARLTRVT